MSMVKNGFTTKNKERVLQWEEKPKISGTCQKCGITRKMAEERLTKIFCCNLVGGNVWRLNR